MPLSIPAGRAHVEEDKTSSNLSMALPAGIAVAEKFGKDAGFGGGLTLLDFIFYPSLGFGGASYRGTPQPPPAA